MSDSLKSTEESPNAKHSNLDQLGLSADWEAAEQRSFRLVEVIARGGFGVVVKAVCSITGLTVAIKQLSGFG